MKKKRIDFNKKIEFSEKGIHWLLWTVSLTVNNHLSWMKKQYFTVNIQRNKKSITIAQI